jgi:hypothetical protein
MDRALIRREKPGARGTVVAEAACAVDMESGSDCAGLAGWDMVFTGCRGRLEDKGRGRGEGEGDGDCERELMDCWGKRGIREGVGGERPLCTSE